MNLGAADGSPDSPKRVRGIKEARAYIRPGRSCRSVRQPGGRDQRADWRKTNPWLSISSKCSIPDEAIGDEPMQRVPDLLVQRLRASASSQPSAIKKRCCLPQALQETRTTLSRT